MDPQTQRLTKSPRDLGVDAFFTEDRSANLAQRTVGVVAVDGRGRDRTDVPVTSESFVAHLNRHAPDVLWEDNPLPHSRMTGEGVVDPEVAGWTHEVSYTCFFSQAARALSPTAPDQPRLRVKLLFGTGSEGFRHGVFGSVENSPEPTLLIIVYGIEPQNPIVFKNPANPGERRRLLPNNRWGVGITVPTIEKAITNRYGRVINYDVTVCAAFSTGYLGLQESLRRRLFPPDKLDLVVIYDCLYATLKEPLERVRSIRPNLRIVAYVVTGAGNSFDKGKPAGFASLTLGGNPAWHYVNLWFNPAYHAVASARVVAEAIIAPAIIDAVPAAYRSALTALTAKLPPRGSMVSDAAVFRKVRGSLPGGATALRAFAADKANAAAVAGFFQQVDVTRHCIGRPWLLGWPAPAGEEWHDLLLIEFAWEYLG